MKSSINKRKQATMVFEKTLMQCDIVLSLIHI